MIKFTPTSKTNASCTRITSILCERAILAPRIDNVNQINLDILKELPGDIAYLNKILEDEDTIRFPTEFLNSQELSGMPHHIIELKVGSPIILSRNLNAPKLCNGTRLCVKSLKPKLDWSCFLF